MSVVYQEMTNRKEVVLIINDVRSVVNVGAIFRTADAIGISKIYLTGYTPAPIDRFGRKRADFRKSALGAEESMKWESVSDIFQLITNLREKKFQIIALEQSDKSEDYKKIVLADNVAIIIGNEVDGVGQDILDKCNVIAEIPMLGHKESLNVSVATGILLFRLFDK